MIREINHSDLKGLLELYTYLHDNNIPEQSAELDRLWEEINSDKNHHIIVAEENGIIVSSCVCVVVPNLTHFQRPYGLIENVITHPDYRGKGFATACLDFAKDIAKSENCYKLMLLTGSKENKTLDFYRHAGYNSLDKTAFIMWL